MAVCGIYGCFWVVAVIVILVFCELWFKLLGLGWLIVLGWCAG